MNATEICKCPNPECGNECRVTESGWGQGYKIVICGDSDGFCGYEGPISKSASEAIRLHNLICRPSAGVPVAELEALCEAILNQHFTPRDGIDDVQRWKQANQWCVSDIRELIRRHTPKALIAANTVKK